MKKFRIKQRLKTDENVVKTNIVPIEFDPF